MASVQVSLERLSNCCSVGVWAPGLQDKGAPEIPLLVHLPHGRCRSDRILGTSSREGVFQAGPVNPHSCACPAVKYTGVQAVVEFGSLHLIRHVLLTVASSEQIPFDSSLISTGLLVLANFCITVALKSGLSAAEIPSQPRTSMAKPLAQAAINTLRTIDALTDLSFLVRRLCCNS